MENSKLIITQIHAAKKTDEFAGADVYRGIGSDDLDNIDPFLLWDAWSVVKTGNKKRGVTPHPHRGFETVTYCLTGGIDHKDSTGKSGSIRSGEVQWMTAGRGVIHEEEPIEGHTTSFQLWVNLSSKDKMCQPKYREISNLPTMALEENAGQLTVISGKSHGLQKNIPAMRTPVQYTDIQLNKNCTYEEIIPSGFQGFIYLVDGSIRVSTSDDSSDKFAKKNQSVIFKYTSLGETSSKLIIKTNEKSTARFFIIAGKPHNEPIERYGPFVMNNKAQIQKAMEDYRRGNLC
jgi:redox-sensitive bicupin YhaK (pirin superfamily)